MVNRKRFAGRRVSRLRVIPTNKFRNSNRSGICRCQRGQMQRLANVARGIPAPVFMLVEKCAARRKVEERDTGQQRQRAARGHFAQVALRKVHATPSVHFNLPF